jgi:hypothetical protein
VLFGDAPQQEDFACGRQHALSKTLSQHASGAVCPAFDVDDVVVMMISMVR